MNELAFSVHDELPEDWRIVDDGLGTANEQAAPIQDVRRLSAFARLPGGEVVGGAVGRIWGAACELQQLWVAPQHRRQGIASRLVKEFERRGRELGCRTFYLETFSFQAPELYRSLGYTKRLELGGFPDGIRKYIMVREE